MPDIIPVNGVNAENFQFEQPEESKSLDFIPPPADLNSRPVGVVPALGGETYLESYQTNEGILRRLGLGVELNAGLNGYAWRNTKQHNVFITAVGRAGANGFPGPTNLFGSMGVRTGYIYACEKGYELETVQGFEVAFEAGYRFNSQDQDHPYVGMEVSGDFAYAGPFLGIQLNPENFSGDKDVMDGSAIHAGVRIGF